MVYRERLRRDKRRGNKVTWEKILSRNRSKGRSRRERLLVGGGEWHLGVGGILRRNGTDEGEGRNGSDETGGAEKWD